MSIRKIALGSAAAVMALGTAAHASVIDRPFFKVLGTVVVWSAPASGTAAGPVVHDFIINTDRTAADGTQDADLIAGDGRAVVTGTLLPLNSSSYDSPFDADGDNTLDPSFGTIEVTDTLGAAIGEYRSSFYVASNTGFAIRAVAKDFMATGDFKETGHVGADGAVSPANDVLYADNIKLTMSVNDGGSAGVTDGTVTFGEHAVDPTGAAAGFGAYGSGTDLSDMVAAVGATGFNGDVVFVGDTKTADAVGTIAEQSVRFDSVYELVNGTGSGYDLSMGAGSLEAEVTYTVYVP